VSKQFFAHFPQRLTHHNNFGTYLGINAGPVISIHTPLQVPSYCITQGFGYSCSLVTQFPVLRFWMTRRRKVQLTMLRIWSNILRVKDLDLNRYREGGTSLTLAKIFFWLVYRNERATRAQTVRLFISVRSRIKSINSCGNVGRSAVSTKAREIHR
jgi:hypothetical protein